MSNQPLEGLNSKRGTGPISLESILCSNNNFRCHYIFRKNVVPNYYTCYSKEILKHRQSKIPAESPPAQSEENGLLKATMTSI